MKDIVCFADPALEAAIRKAIDKPEGDIHKSDLQGLTRLDTEEMDISDLTGLEYAKGLVELRLWLRGPTDISPLASLTELTTLYLGGGTISDISPLANLTNLKGFGLENNQIRDISPLTHLTKPTELWISKNQISDMSPLTGLIKLRDLHISNNRIRDLSPLVENEGLAERGIRPTYSTTL